MSAIIKTLKTKTDDVEQSVYPKTVLEAVVDAETNETLDVVLDEINTSITDLNEKIDNFEPSGGGGTTYELSRTDDTITLIGEDGSSSEVNISDKINTSHIAKVKDYLGYSRNLIIYDRVMYRKGSSGTTNGVQYTILDDYSLLLNGTATADIYRPVGGPNIGANENLGELMASGCPAGGNSETGYCLRISVENSSGEYDTYYDIGQGVKFTPEVLSSGSSINVTYIIKNGTSLNNVIFYPMVCIASEADGTYEPNYGDGNGKIPELENNKVSKSGDTMTGDLTVKANVNIPLLADNSDTTMVTVPTAGTVDIGSTEQKITDVLTSYKSFIGSIHTKDAWNSIISTRHRNGYSDGVSHGMYLRSLMNRGNADLIWNNQNAGTWENERTILDSRNYSSNIPAATQSAVGLMSAADKKKLDGIATGANAYSLPTASSSRLGGVKTTSTVTSNSGYTACPIISGVPYYKDTNTTYSAATTSANGLMTAAMVTKLNGIAEGANKITVDGSMSTTSTNPVQNKIVKGQLPSSNQNSSSGYIRFPSAKIQIAWIKKTVSATINTAWGGLYECASPFTIGNWAAAFSSAPVVSYNAYAASGDNVDLGVNAFAPPSTTAAGSVYLNRGAGLATAKSILITAFAVGTYA